MQKGDLLSKVGNTESWNQVKKSLKVGTKLTGLVTRHFAFGVFVSLPEIEFTGLIQIIDFKDDGVMTPSDYPEIGSSVNLVVLGFKETGQQIWLGAKPSQLNQSKINLEQ